MDAAPAHRRRLLYWELAGPATHFVVRTFDGGRRSASSDRNLALCAPLLALLNHLGPHGSGLVKGRTGALLTGRVGLS